ncbi:hypothetical protein [Rhodococcus sp. IEGM 1408]|uniref:hypothetical protein n=1 Tax=Rhodococcus sp. IEGM 1408 TaxID=3082220 RepID=UPI00295593EB|nr:hypothetical protein [Rhodococcus sp. IEGM 1408]MDV8000827.1 hypothetical protein [Rhodococcus sp. IEGM 1408]
MTDKPEDDTSAARPDLAREGEPTTSTTPPQPVVSGDPLGLLGMPEPDAPSRRPRPKIVSLLGEFFKMSRTTAILLVTFVLVSILYSMVKDAPVLRVGPPPVPTQTLVPSEQVTPSPSTEQATETSVPTEPTTSAPTELTTEDPESLSRQTTTPSSDRLGSRTTQQAPQGTQQQQQAPQQQEQTQQQPQLQPQRVPEGTVAGPTGDGRTAE